ncbi:hypothetical protein PM023_16090 [Halorubrum ezzemoulense]|uniref:hypothetical protein n=1 Tax=Halorubrum ezzemoulense TaxID=337243 RepID=UPI00232D5AF2|nr:hypothetical protein [Halorubrum ezzemoulense]MDB2226167.1 hypothetical protein [Halorubrum ezzemoulense]
MTDDTYGHGAEYDFKYSKTRIAATIVAAILLGATLTLLFFQFPEITGWTIERVYDNPSPVSPI